MRDVPSGTYVVNPGTLSSTYLMSRDIGDTSVATGAWFEGLPAIGRELLVRTGGRDPVLR